MKLVSCINKEQFICVAKCTLFAFVISLFLGKLQVWAACTAPAANAGAIEYFSATKETKYCNGTNWVPTKYGGIKTVGSLSGGTLGTYAFTDGIAISGNHVFIGGQRGGSNYIAIIDISTISSPIVVAEYAVTQGSVSSIGISGTTLFYIAGTSLVALNISSPTAPTYLGVITNTYLNGADAIVAGGYVYSQSSGRLQIFNVSTPSAMTLTSTFSHSTFKNDSGMVLSGNYLVTVPNYYTSVLNIVDITNKSAPVMTSSTSLSGVSYAKSIAITGNHLYVTNSSGSSDPLKVYDITNKSSPTLAKSLVDEVTWTMGVVINGSYAYVVTGNGELITLDVSNPANPAKQQVVSAMGGWGNGFSDVLISGSKLIAYSKNRNFLVTFDASLQPTVIMPEVGEKLNGGPSNPSNTQVVGTIGVVNDSNGHLWTFDVSNPAAMTYISQARVANSNSAYTPGSFFDGTYFFFADPNSSGLDVYDLSTVSNPVRLNDIRDSSKLAQVMALTKSGNYVYTAASSGFSVIDVTSINSASIVGFNNSVSLSWADEVIVSGNYAFVLISGSVYVFDVSVKTSPSLVGSLTNSNLNNSNRMAMSGNYLYVATSAGIAVVDITVKTAPALYSTLALSGGTSDIEVSGSYAYVNGYYFRVIDISNPATLVQKSSVMCSCVGIAISGNTLFQGSQNLYGLSAYNISNPLSVTSISTLSYYGSYDWSADLALSGTYAYTSSDPAKAIYVTDFSNPTAPTVLGSITDATRFNTISDFEIAGNYLYVSSQNYLSIVDISTPAAPALVGSVNNGPMGATKRVKVSGNYSFVLSDARLTVINSTTKTSPTVSTSLTNASMTGCKSMELSGNYLYLVCTTSIKLVIVDISTPTSPSVVGSVSLGTYTSGEDLVVLGNYVYVADSKINIVNVSNKTSPFIMASFDGVYGCGGCSPSYHLLSGSTLYYSGNSGLTAWDVSDPSSPEMLGMPLYNNIKSSPARFEISGNSMIWLTQSRLQVFNITNAPVPRKFASSLPLGSKFSNISAVSLAGNYAYTLSNGSGTFSIVDVSDPLNPILLGSITSPLFFTSSSLAVSGNYAYISETGNYGLTVINVSNPAAPVYAKKMLSNYPVFSGTYDLLVSGNYLYVTANSYFSSVNISDPTSPVVLDTEYGSTFGLVKTGNYVISCGLSASGLSIADVTDPANIVIYSFAHSGIDSCRSPVLSGNNLFVLNEYSDSISVYDFSNPLAPSFVSTLTNATALDSVSSLRVSGNYAYITSYSGLVTLVDVSNPASMAVVDSRAPVANHNKFELSAPYMFISNSSAPSFDVLKVTPPATLGSCSVQGRIDFISVSNAYGYCDGTNFIAMGPSPGAGGAGCSSPAGAKATIEYDTGLNKFKYCDGASWIVIE